MVFNVGRALAFTDFNWVLKNILSLAQFKDAYISCHDINVLCENMDVVIGFQTGDILCYSPITGKYARLNRQGAIHKHAVTSITWIPVIHVNQGI